MVERLENKNNEYNSELEKTAKMYEYITKIEQPIAENLEVVDKCQELKQDLDEYFKLLKEQNIEEEEKQRLEQEKAMKK